jgi:hypothetical protein
VGIFALGFVLIGVAAYLAVRGNTESSLKFVWASIVFSLLGAVLALASVFFPRR